MIDPVCVFHGRRRSEHRCLYCCLCFKNLTEEECNVLPDGTKENVCKECAAMEKTFGGSEQMRQQNDSAEPAQSAREISPASVQQPSKYL